jgi:hypothetical protein
MKQIGDTWYCVDCGLEVEETYEIETVDKWCPECGGGGFADDGIGDCDYCGGDGVVWW